jgi:hypothetical protein
MEELGMEESAFRTAPELEARRSLHEAIGRFVVAFELVVAELRSACRLMLERSGLGLKNQPLANIVLARASAAELTELAGAMYREFRPGDDAGAQALAPILKRVDTLRESRNKLIHSAWTLGLPDEQGPAGGNVRPDLIRGQSISVFPFGTGNFPSKRPFMPPFLPLLPEIFPVLTEVGNRCGASSRSRIYSQSYVW